MAYDEDFRLVRNMLEINEFINEVMQQLNPFLKAGSRVKFELNVGCQPVKGKGMLPIVGCGESKVSFVVIVDGATEHTPES